MTDEVKTPAEVVKPAETEVVAPVVPDEAPTEPSTLQDEDRFVEEQLGTPETEDKEEMGPEKVEEVQEPVETPKEEVQEKVEPKEEIKEVSKELPRVELFKQTEPTKLDKRIAKLYVNNLVLAGQESDIQFENVLEEVKKYPLEEKKAALGRLLSQQKRLRGQEDDGRMSEEDHEAIIDAEADRKFQELQREIAEKEWHEDLIRTVEAHPELNDKVKQYDPVLAGAVENLVQRGMKASEALEFIKNVSKEVRENAVKDQERERQKALSGSVTATAPKGSQEETPKDAADRFVEEIMG